MVIISHYLCVSILGAHFCLFLTPWTVAHCALLFMGFPRQEYWIRLPFPSPRNLPYPGIEPTSPALAGRVFTTEPPGKPPSFCSSHELKSFSPLAAFTNVSLCL